MTSEVSDGHEAPDDGDDSAEMPTQIGPDHPQRLGRYRLCFELAAGGMATVYLARAEGAQGFEKLVALKRIHPHLAREPQFVDMFLDEARIASRIDHPNVCGVFDFGEERGTYFLTMEYLVGEPLSKVIRTAAKHPDARTSPRYESIAAKVVADACEGLHAAHELHDVRGEPLHVVHRDVSPQNLFLGYDGSTRVVDFGIAGARDKVHQTETGMVKGKYAYMAPEQLDRQPLDRRVDVWALGVVLWEMLTFRRLFRREKPYETIVAVTKGRIPRPSAVREGIPEALQDIVMRALERDPEARYATGRDFARDLLRFVASQPDPVTAPDVAEWMDALFPGARAKKLQLADIARQREDRVPVVGERESSSSAYSAVRDAPARATHWARPAALSGAALALLGGVFFAGLSLGGDPSDAQPGAVPGPIARDADGGVDGGRAGAATVAGDTGPADTDDAGPDAGPDAGAATPTERTPRRAGPGIVNVVSGQGWAEVRRGGRSLGYTPLRLELPAGSHALEVLPSGRPPARRVTVRVRAGRTTRLVL